MTSEQYYHEANEKIAQMKKAGKDPFAKAKKMLELAAANGSYRFTLKNMFDEKDTMEFELRRVPHAYELNYENGVRCHALPDFAYHSTQMAERLTEELLAMSFNMDLTWKQYFIDVARANGEDV